MNSICIGICVHQPFPRIFREQRGNKNFSPGSARAHRRKLNTERSVTTTPPAICCAGAGALATEDTWKNPMPKIKPSMRMEQYQCGPMYKMWPPKLKTSILPSQPWLQVASERSGGVATSKGLYTPASAAEGGSASTGIYLVSWRFGQHMAVSNHWLDHSAPNGQISKSIALGTTRTLERESPGGTTELCKNSTLKTHILQNASPEFIPTQRAV